MRSWDRNPPSREKEDYQNDIVYNFFFFFASTHCSFGGQSGASMILAELAMEAGLPNGILNIVHGTNVNFEFTVCFYS